MRLICPACGAAISLEACLLDDEARRALAVILALPPEVAPLIVRYLALFRGPSAKRGLAWGKVNRLVAELADLIKAGEVVWQHGSARQATPAMWAEAIQTVLDRVTESKLELPLANHNYLRTVVYGIANHADAQAETKRELDRRQAGPGRQQEPQSEPKAIDFEKSAQNALRLREMLKGKAVGGENNG